MKTKVVALISGFTSMLQVFALCTPWWIVLVRQGEDRRYVYGLWYTLHCDVSQGISFCKAVSHYNDSEKLFDFLEYQVETLLGAVLMLAATVIGTFYMRDKSSKNKQHIGIIAVVLYTTSGILVLITVGNVSRLNIETAQSISVDVPWSLVVSGLSGIASLVLCAIFLPYIVSSIRTIVRDREATRALSYKIQSSTASLYTTDLSMDSLPRSYLNAGSNITPAISISTIPESTVLPDVSQNSSLKRTTEGEVFL